MNRPDDGGLYAAHPSSQSSLRRPPTAGRGSVRAEQKRLVDSGDRFAAAAVVKHAAVEAPQARSRATDADTASNPEIRQTQTTNLIPGLGYPATERPVADWKIKPRSAIPSLGSPSRLRAHG